MTVLILALAALQVPAASNAQPLPADWRTRPLTAGAWTWRGTAEVSEAIFSDSRGRQLFVRCTRATRSVSFSRTGAAPSASIRVATTSTQQQLPASNSVLSNDPLLDAIAFSRGRLWVDVQGTLPLVMRSAAEPARSIEDCRS
jgi:hypothetical protein